ncbi:MAG TPA: carboxypeptidase regulatory-like domain-containing protein [Ignavibacteriales bacterium]|nr:carboxypeptidase regulatory-like domain-containing protein [Ignavibacteriales bacterium]
MKKTILKSLLILLFVSGFFVQTYSQTPAPTGLKAALSRMEMGKGVLLSWEYSAKVFAKFSIYRKDGAVTDTGSFKKLEKTAYFPYFLDGSVVSGKKYTYYVTASLSGQESQPSNSVDVEVNYTDSSRVTVTGLIVSDSLSKPVFKGRVQFMPVNPMSVPYFMSAVSDSQGRFSAKLMPGSYYVFAGSEHFIGEFYDNARTRDQAQVITAAQGSSLNLSISLAPYIKSVNYTVSGSVKNSEGKPVRAKIKVFRMNAVVNNEKENGDEKDDMKPCNVFGTSTDDQGNYTVKVKSSDTIVVFASPVFGEEHMSSQAYLPQFYNNRQTLQEADKLVASSNLTGINFVLERKAAFKNSISGQVADTLSNGVAAGVVAYRIGEGKYGFSKSGALTDSTGKYTLTNLVPGKYILLAIPRAGYMPSFYRQDGMPVFARKLADTLVMADSTVKININITVRKLNIVQGTGSITGFIKDTDGKSVNGALSLVVNEKGQFAGYAISDASGEYTVGGLASGNYTLSADMYEYKETQPAYASVTSDNVTPVVSFTMEAASVSSASEDNGAVPSAYSLKQNYPNPFNPSTTISFSIPEKARVTLKIYNILGSEVASIMNEEKPAGKYSVVFNAGSLPSGIYFYTLSSGKYSVTKKLVLLK